MQWSARVVNGCTVLTVSGSIHGADAARLQLLLRPATGLVLDLREVTFLDPVGLDVLADVASRFADQPWPLAIVIGNRHQQVLRVIEDAHLQALRLFDTVEHAVAAGPIQDE
jgi:anti-anti-sigma factor